MQRVCLSRSCLPQVDALHLMPSVATTLVRMGSSLHTLSVASKVKLARQTLSVYVYIAAISATATLVLKAERKSRSWGDAGALTI